MDRVRAIILIIIIVGLAIGFLVLDKVTQEQFMAVAYLAIGWLFGSEVRK